MNRRHFMAGSMALAGPQKLLHSMEALPISGPAAAGAQQITRPRDLLSTTYTESFLESKLP